MLRGPCFQRAVAGEKSSCMRRTQIVVNARGYKLCINGVLDVSILSERRRRRHRGRGS